MLGAPQSRTMTIRDAAGYRNGNGKIAYKPAAWRFLPRLQRGARGGAVADRPRRLDRRAEAGRGARFGTTAAPLRSARRKAGAEWSFRR